MLGDQSKASLFWMGVVFLTLTTFLSVPGSAAAALSPMHPINNLDTQTPRRQERFRQSHRGVLQEKLSTTAAVANDPSKSRRLRQIKQLLQGYAEANNSPQRRQRQTLTTTAQALSNPKCTFNLALAMKCSLEEFCRDLATPIVNVMESTTSSANEPFYICQGDFHQQWSIMMQQAEVCYYEKASSNGLGQPTEEFDDSKFDPDTDYCWMTTTVVHMDQWDSVALEEIFELTRPFRHVYQQKYALQPCGSLVSNGIMEYLEEDVVGITGGDYCKASCTQASVDGKICNSCQARTIECPSLIQPQVDCHNVHESLVSTCPDDQDIEESSHSNILSAFIDYAGADCTFGGLFQGECTLDKYCERLRASRRYGNDHHDVVVTCYGDIHQDWVIKLRHNEEVCFYMNDYHEYGKAYDAETFNHATDYCVHTVLRIDLHVDQPVAEEFVYEITRPVEDGGVVREKSQLAPCANSDDLASSDYIFEKGYCYQGCPEVVIGDKVCTTNCFVCSDGYQALDCSNVDEALVERCSIDKDNYFVEEVVTYFRNDSPSTESFGIGDMEKYGHWGQSDVSVLNEKSPGATYGSLLILPLVVVAFI